MSKVDVYNSEKKVVSSVDLNPAVFGVEVKEHLFWDVVKMQLANRRSGTARTKTRAEVAGSGKKPYRQKGTGRARAGSVTSPLWVGGGTTFGPKPRDHSYKVPKKIRKAALRSALIKKLSEDKLMIIDAFDISEIKTKRFMEIMENFELTKALIVIAEHDRNLELSARNIRGIKILMAEGLNVFDILKFEKLVITRGALETINKALS
jgi:large subunit ribosomal protein L4